MAHGRARKGTPECDGVAQSAVGRERDRQSRRATREGVSTAKAVVQPTASAGWRPAERWQSPRPHGLAVRWASPQPPQQRRRSPQPRGSSRVASAANASTAPRGQRCVAAGKVQAQSQQVEGMGGRTAAQWQRVADAGARDTLAVGAPLVAVLARAAPVTQLLSGWSLLAGCAAATARGVSPLRSIPSGRKRPPI